MNRYLQRFVVWVCGFRLTVRDRAKRVYRKLGSLPDLADFRDIKYAISGANDLPVSSSLESFASPVKDQGRLNSCVSHSAGLCYEMEQRRRGIEFDVSELQLYYDGRSLGGLLPGDRGMYARDCLKVMLNKGVSPEKLWPYDPNKLNDVPKLSGSLSFISLGLESYEKLFRIKSYHWVMNLSGVKQELATGHPVMVNVPLYDNVLSADGGWIGLPTGTFSGYHQITVIGYDDTFSNPGGSTGAFLIQNSWGKNWGRNGRAWMDYRFFTQELPHLPLSSKFYSLRVA